MKRIGELTTADLDLAPVWRYEGDSDDDARLIATDRRELRAHETTAYIARTQFVLATGVQFVGFCSPVGNSRMEDLQPVILTSEGPVYFWFEEPPSREFLAAQAARLGVEPEDVFPVRFRCTVPVDGKFITGTITEDDLTGAA